MFKSKLTPVVFAIAGLLVTSPASSVSADSDKNLVLGVDKASLYRLEQPASTVIIGNPSIADVNVQDGNLLVFTGKNFGTTNVIILDEKDQEIVEFDVSVGSNNASSMTVYKGASRSSYNCNPVCENSLSVGDTKDNFNLVKKQIDDKMSISRGDENAGQSPDN